MGEGKDLLETLRLFNYAGAGGLVSKTMIMIAANSAYTYLGEY